MRRMTYFVMALALVLGFTQCKKEQPASQAEGVRITLTVDGGNDGSRVAVDPTNGGAYNFAPVTFEKDDIIYVGNNGHYCGFLKHDGDNFTGTIDDTNLSTSDYLHFYFMGNKGGESQPSSVSITDQTSKYPVISYAHSTVKYASGTTSYSANLENYCAIVKFTTTNIDADITITGMNNTVSVNFGANNAADGTGVDKNPYTPSKTGDGEITLHKESNTERWAILLPQGEVTTATAYALQNVATKYVSTSTFTVPAIDNNMYYTNDGSGISISLTEYVPYINAQFTVANGTKVKFSKGNLQYKGTTGRFRFAENQYDYVGGTAGNTAPSASQAAWMDWFYWGTSGYNKAPYYRSGYNGDFGDGSNNIAGTNHDWGVYNKQSNQNKIEGGGNNAWRTLTKEEWTYVFNERTTTSGHKYAKATVCSKAGVILLPDNWSDGTYTLSNYNSGGAAFTGNTIDAAGWATLEAAGCVFLPASGYWQNSASYVGSAGCYWSSTASNSNGAYYVNIYSSAIEPARSNFNRTLGYSVRLVF